MAVQPDSIYKNPRIGIDIEDLKQFKSKKMHNLRIEYAIKALSGRKNFLEVGCGEGFCTRSIAYWSNHSFDRIEGFDIDEIRLQKAKLSWNANGVIQYHASNAENTFPYKDEEFDSVVMLDILEHVENPQVLIGEAYRVLKRGGSLFLVVPCEGEYWTLHRYLHSKKWDGSRVYGGHIQQFTKKQILELLAKNNYSTSWIRYSGHWIAQVTDYIGFEIKRLFELKNNNQLGRLGSAKLYLYKKMAKTFLQKISYFESKLFSKVSFAAMDLNIHCIKK